jgi:hypothetical protein
MQAESHHHVDGSIAADATDQRTTPSCQFKRLHQDIPAAGLITHRIPAARCHGGCLQCTPEALQGNKLGQAARETSDTPKTLAGLRVSSWRRGLSTRSAAGTAGGPDHCQQASRKPELSQTAGRHVQKSLLSVLSSCCCTASTWLILSQILVGVEQCQAESGTHGWSSTFLCKTQPRVHAQVLRWATVWADLLPNSVLAIPLGQNGGGIPGFSTTRTSCYVVPRGTILDHGCNFSSWSHFRERPGANRSVRRKCRRHPNVGGFPKPLPAPRSGEYSPCQQPRKCTLTFADGLQRHRTRA